GGAVSISADSSNSLFAIMLGDQFLSNSASGGTGGGTVNTLLGGTGSGGLAAGGAVHFDARASSSALFAINSSALPGNIAVGGTGGTAGPAQSGGIGGTAEGGAVWEEASSSKNAFFLLVSDPLGGNQAIGGPGGPPPLIGGSGGLAEGGAVWQDADKASSP